MRRHENSGKYGNFRGRANKLKPVEFLSEMCKPDLTQLAQRQWSNIKPFIQKIIRNKVYKNEKDYKYFIRNSKIANIYTNYQVRNWRRRGKVSPALFWKLRQRVLIFTGKKILIVFIYVSHSKWCFKSI